MNFMNMPNQYVPTEKQQGTPYHKMYYASNSLRPKKLPAPVVVTPDPRRKAMLILVIVLMLAIIGIYAASFVAGSNSALSLYNKEGDIPDIQTIEGEDGDTLETVSQEDDEEDALEDGLEDLAITPVTVDDIIYSLLKKFAIAVPEDQSIVFYRDSLQFVDDAEMSTKIGIYLVPVSIILTVAVALFIMIKAILGLTSAKRRKFPYITLILLLFTMLGLVGGFIWTGLPVGDFVSYLTFANSGLTIGTALIAILGAEALALLLSFFAYKSKKTTAPYYLFKDGSTAPVPTQKRGKKQR